MITDETLKVLTGKTKLLENGDNANVVRNSILKGLNKAGIKNNFPGIYNVFKNILKVQGNHKATAEEIAKCIFAIAIAPAAYKCSLDFNAVKTYFEDANGQAQLLKTNKSNVNASVIGKYIANMFKPGVEQIGVQQTALALTNGTSVSIVDKPTNELLATDTSDNQVADYVKGQLMAIAKMDVQLFKDENAEVVEEDDNGVGGDGENVTNITDSFLIWPANPYLVTQKTKSNLTIAENLIRKQVVGNGSVFMFVPRQGADGDFSSSCIDQYLNSKLGVSSALAKGKYKIITSVKTLATEIHQLVLTAQGKNVENKEHDNTGLQSVGASTTVKESLSPREMMRTKLFEDEAGTQTITGNESQNIKTNANMKPTSVTKTVTENQVTIYCTPRIKNEFEAQKQLFAAAGVNINILTEFEGQPFVDDNESLAGGKEIFSTILSFINGKKSFSAAKQDTQDTIKSQGQQKIGESTTIREASSPESWDWEKIKANQGAKQFLQQIFADVEAIKKGMDDGGNPSKLTQTVKGIYSEVGKKYAAALTDGADLMMEGYGLGWMMPLIKRGIEEFKKSPEEYVGIEAFVRSDDFKKNICKYIEEPDFYIEHSEEGSKL